MKLKADLRQQKTKNSLNWNYKHKTTFNACTSPSTQFEIYFTMSKFLFPPILDSFVVYPSGCHKNFLKFFVAANFSTIH